jgi:hypothetical protein
MAASICAECAFRKGCETWHEPRNHLVSQICAAGPLVFLCHAGIDWQNPQTHLLSVRALAQTGSLRVCEGWKRAVAARQWPADPALRRYQRMLARAALTSAYGFLAAQVSERELQRDLTPLAQFYRGPRAWQVVRMLERELRRQIDDGATSGE